MKSLFLLLFLFLSVSLSAQKFILYNERTEQVTEITFSGEEIKTHPYAAHQQNDGSFTRAYTVRDGVIVVSLWIDAGYKTLLSIEKFNDNGTLVYKTEFVKRVKIHRNEKSKSKDTRYTHSR